MQTNLTPMFSAIQFANQQPSVKSTTVKFGDDPRDADGDGGHDGDNGAGTLFAGKQLNITA